MVDSSCSYSRTVVTVFKATVWSSSVSDGALMKAMKEVVVYNEGL